MIAILTRSMAFGRRWVTQNENVVLMNGQGQGRIRHPGGHEEEFMIVCSEDRLRGRWFTRIVDLGVSAELLEIAKTRVQP